MYIDKSTSGSGFESIRALFVYWAITTNSDNSMKVVSQRPSHSRKMHRMCRKDASRRLPIVGEDTERLIENLDNGLHPITSLFWLSPS